MDGVTNKAEGLIMGLGLLLGAVSGAGQGAQAGLASEQQAQQALDLEQAKSDVDLQRQMALMKASNDMAIANRMALAQRLAIPQGLLNSTIAANAQDPNNPNSSEYVNAPAGATQEQIDALPTSPATFEQMDTADQTNPANAMTDSQIMQAKAMIALNSGDIGNADAIISAANKGEVVIPYGGIGVDKNNNNSVFADNSTGKTQGILGRNTAYQTSADARLIQAQAIANAQGSKDPVLKSMGDEAKMLQIHADELIKSGSDPALIQAAQANADDASIRVVNQQMAHGVTIPANPGASSLPNISGLANPGAAAARVAASLGR